MSGLRRRYGAGPVHLLAHLVMLPLVLWAILQVVDISAVANVLLWFVAGLILHDLVLLPAYSGLDRLTRRARLRGVPVVNYVRFPSVISGLTFLAFVGNITGKSNDNFALLTGLRHEGYLERYLIMVAVLFGVSAVLLAWRVARADGLGAPTVAGPSQT
ncbi:MAG: hypothetical protein M3417_06710 [Actinomycetota bacterium]|nr:hypothetical protein [Actinomycetota bacterium]